MRRREKTQLKLFSLGLGGVVLMVTVMAGLHGRRQNPDAVIVKPLAPLTFHDMERPDPVTLLTPVRLPDHKRPRP